MKGKIFLLTLLVLSLVFSTSAFAIEYIIGTGANVTAAADISADNPSDRIWQSFNNTRAGNTTYEINQINIFI